MKKTSTKKYAFTSLLAALALGFAGAGIAGMARTSFADAPQDSEPTASSTVKTTPLLETSFDDGTVGQSYDIYSKTREWFWDQNYAAGSIVDKFDGKAYRYTLGQDATFGGIKTFGAVVGESYTLTMKADYEGCDFIYVEYVAQENALGNSRWGSFKLYHDRIEHQGGNNSFADYNAASKEFTFTVTAGANTDEGATGMGFFKFTASSVAEGVKLDVDDVKISVADTIMDENCERLALGALANEGEYNKFWNDASSISVAEYGTGNKAVKFTANDSAAECCTFGWINRLGFITNNETYLVSFDYEICGYSILFIEYVPQNGGAGIKVLASGEVQADWNAGVNLTNAKVEVDAQNPAKGRVSFELRALENKTELKFTGKQEPVNADGEHALILDNIKIDAVRSPITAEVTEGKGSISALTYNPRTGTDCTVTVAPETGYRVKSVLVDGNPAELTGNAYTFTNIAGGEHTLSVAFERIAITVAAEASAGVTVQKTENVFYGDEVVFEVTLAENYKLVSVKLNGNAVELTGNRYVVASATEDLTFTATAQEIPEYTVTYSSSPQGGG